MSNFKYKLTKEMSEKFSDVSLELTETPHGVVCVVPLESWLEVSKVLRDDEAFQFEQCLDVCGVDYLTYGEAEWQTDGVSSTTEPPQQIYSELILLAFRSKRIYQAL